MWRRRLGTRGGGRVGVSNFGDASSRVRAGTARGRCAGPRRRMDKRCAHPLEATRARADALAPGSGRGGGGTRGNARGEGRTATAGRRIERARCEGGARTRDAGAPGASEACGATFARRASALATTARGREASEARRAARAVDAARNRADAEAAVGVATADIIAARSLGPHAPPSASAARSCDARWDVPSGRVPLDPSRRGRVARRLRRLGALVLRRGERTGASVRGERGRGARASRRVRAVASTENDAPDGCDGEQKVCHASSSRRASVEPIARAHGEEFVNAERPRGRRASRPGRKKKARPYANPVQKFWRRGASIPLPSACKADALPFELRPPCAYAQTVTGGSENSRDWARADCGGRVESSVYHLYFFMLRAPACSRDGRFLPLGGADGRSPARRGSSRGGRRDHGGGAESAVRAPREPRGGLRAQASEPCVPPTLSRSRVARARTLPPRVPRPPPARPSSS